MGTRSRVPETSLNSQTLRHTEQIGAFGRNLEPMNSHKLCPRPRHVLPANDPSSLPSGLNAITDCHQMSTEMRKGVGPTCLPVQLEIITPAKVECRLRPPSADSLQYTTVLDPDCLPVLGKLRKDSALPHCTNVLHYHTERRHRTTTQQRHTALLHYDDALLCHTASSHCTATLSHCTATLHYPCLVYVCTGSQTRALLTSSHTYCQSRVGQSSAAQGRVAQHRAEQSRAEQNSAEQSRGGQCRAEQCRAVQDRAVQDSAAQSRVKQCNERTTVNCNGDSLQCCSAVSLTRLMCSVLPALPVASEKSSAVQSRVKQCSERTIVNCNGDSLQCCSAVSLTRPMCSVLPALPVASEKSSAVQGRAGQYRTEKNSEHQKVVPSAHLRSFNIYSVQNFIILSSFHLLPCTKLPSPIRVARCKAKQSRAKAQSNCCIIGDTLSKAKQSKAAAPQHHTALSFAPQHHIALSLSRALSRALKLGRKINDIETNQNLTNKLNEHNK